MLTDNKNTLEGGHNDSMASMGSKQSVFKFNRSTISQTNAKRLDTIKQLLSKPAEQRSTYEIRTLLTPLMADIGFFKERKLKQ